MSADTHHPHWCASGRCEVSRGGAHRSEPVRVNGHDREIRFLIMLAQVPGQPTRVRVVMIGDLLVASADLDLDTGDLAAASIHQVVRSAARPEDT